MRYEREGGLRLCECEHPMGYHPTRPAWFFHAGSSDAAKAAPMVTHCAFCDCTTPREGAFQGSRCEQSSSPCK